ncbi:uncharacterized protein LOC129602160 [Paramacrobiotus metropolitanus]|uniref:uncharacterized protein LOC129602160 n=1 Tax=Paramacrobiotus metropolitanus TaxID=2943436 RepID=UPI0024461885|nr:uncharacterized protein LOC129602160 [Paramacrobiotus metropolitanus]
MIKNQQLFCNQDSLGYTYWEAGFTVVCTSINRDSLGFTDGKYDRNLAIILQPGITWIHTLYAGFTAVCTSIYRDSLRFIDRKWLKFLAAFVFLLQNNALPVTRNVHASSLGDACYYSSADDEGSEELDQVLRNALNGSKKDDGEAENASVPEAKEAFPNVDKDILILVLLGAAVVLLIGLYMLPVCLRWSEKRRSQNNLFWPERTPTGSVTPLVVAVPCRYASQPSDARTVITPYQVSEPLEQRISNARYQQLPPPLPPKQSARPSNTSLQTRNRDFTSFRTSGRDSPPPAPLPSCASTWA